jgi:hypothetical protein
MPAARFNASLAPPRRLRGYSARAGPDIWCSVNWGAEHTISEPDKGKIHVARFRGFTPIRETA